MILIGRNTFSFTAFLLQIWPEDSWNRLQLNPVALNGKNRYRWLMDVEWDACVLGIIVLLHDPLSAKGFKFTLSGLQKQKHRGYSHGRSSPPFASIDSCLHDISRVLFVNLPWFGCLKSTYPRYHFSRITFLRLKTAIYFDKAPLPHVLTLMPFCSKPIFHSNSKLLSNHHILKKKRHISINCFDLQDSLTAYTENYSAPPSLPPPNFPWQCICCNTEVDGTKLWHRRQNKHNLLKSGWQGLEMLTAPRQTSCCEQSWRDVH